MGTLREILLSIGTWTYVVVGLDILLESSAFLGLVLNWQLLDSIPAPVGGGITGAIFLGYLHGRHGSTVYHRTVARFKTKLGGSLG
jgi:hypothetical protein